MCTHDNILRTDNSKTVAYSQEFVRTLPGKESGRIARHVQRLSVQGTGMTTMLALPPDQHTGLRPPVPFIYKENSMNGPSNLPPGVSVSDIPGNRPEDEEWDQLHAHIDHIADQSDYTAKEIEEIFVMGLELYTKTHST